MPLMKVTFGYKLEELAVWKSEVSVPAKGKEMGFHSRGGSGLSEKQPDQGGWREESRVGLGSLRACGSL